MIMRTKLIRALILTLALVVCLGMLLSSCGEDETVPSTTGTTAPTTPTTGSTAGSGTTDSSNATTDSSNATTDSSEPTTDSSEPTTDSSEPTTDSSEPTTGSSEPTTDSSEPTTDSSEPTTGSSDETTDSSKPGDEDKPCEHVWREATCLVPKTCIKCKETMGDVSDEHVGGEATCAKLASCELCGEEYGDYGAHSWTEATCTAPKKCTVCKVTEGTDLGGHIGGESTCASRAKCDRCGEEYGELGTHVYDKTGDCYVINPEPTCSSEGTKYYKCTVCDKRATSKDYIETVPALPHSMAVATCTSPSKCTECGYEEGNALPHDTNPATCVLPITCKNCSYTEGEALGHTYNKEAENTAENVYYVVAEPTCIKEGKKAYVCTVCSEEAEKGSDDYEVIPVIEHAYIEDENYLVDTVAPNCFEKGYKSYKCCVDPDCVSEKRYETDEPLANHVYDVELEPVAPTCSEEGYTPFGCSVAGCGTYDYRNYVERAAHNFVPHATLGDFDIIVCTDCQASYVNEKTGINSSNEVLCLGSCGAEAGAACECGVSVELTGYTKPEAPYEITANEAFAKDELEIGCGLVKIVCDEEATYTIVIGDKTIEKTGTEVVIDLYKYESVASVTITSTHNATVVFYEVF